MLSFKALSEKKTKVKVNPKMKDVMEDGAPITMHAYSKGGKVKKKKDIVEGGCDSVPKVPEMAKGGKLDLKKNHGDDCDCKKCDKKRRRDDVNDGPDVANEEIKKLKSFGEAVYTGPNKDERKLIKKLDNKEFATKLADYEKNMDPKKRQALKDKATKGMKFTHEETYIKNNNQAIYGNQEEVSEESNQSKSETETSILRFSDFNEATRFKKEKGYVKGGTKKPTTPKSDKPSAMDFVRAELTKKYGKGAIISGGSKQQKKVKGAKSTVGTGKYKKAADQKKQTAADAKKRGFKSVQNYTDTMARYGGKDNYDKGRGLGS